MKKLMKLGSLLVTLSLLLSVMPGMSVQAATGYDSHLTVGQILYPGDTITVNGHSGLVIYIDNVDRDDRIVNKVFTVEQGEQFEVKEKEESLRGDAGHIVYVFRLATYTPTSSTPDNNTNASNAPEKEDKHEHNWEWIQIQAATDAQDGVEVMCCTECGQQGETRKIANSAYGMFCNATADKISKAAENATVEMETEIWSALPKSVMDAIKERRDLTVNLTLTYQNKEYPLSIPAGYDMSVLEEADWYGVLYLNQFFGVANQ
ncbi:MAG: hypothetical protein J6J79_12440 [Lachnospiraceae bacterium]|nr:hypothetical protein [Lachnospiraceae bacterium]